MSFKALFILAFLLAVLVFLETQKDVEEGFSLSDRIPSMSYIIFITLMFGLFGPIVWLGFLF
jgi:hypothetical protein